MTVERLMGCAYGEVALDWGCSGEKKSRVGQGNGC